VANSKVDEARVLSGGESQSGSSSDAESIGPVVFTAPEAPVTELHALSPPDSDSK